MIFRQLFDHESYTFTYLIASGPGREALLIDPVLERVEQYLGLIKQLDLKLVKAIDTHVHADHITGLGKLRETTACTTMMGEQTSAECVSQTLTDNEIIKLENDIEIKALYTPGHTDDSYSFLWNNKVFTGDTLFIRGTGRTDFQNGDPYDQYNSIFNRLLKLPDTTLVYPGHDYNGMNVSSIGEEKRFNPRLQVNSADEYAELMNNLNLPNPRLMDVAVPANQACGMAS